MRRWISLTHRCQRVDAFLADRTRNLAMLEPKLYIGERVGVIGERVPQNPLARDLAAWQARTRLKPLDLELEIKLDLRSEAGLLKSTLLHRLNLINVPWGLAASRRLVRLLTDRKCTRARG